MPAKDRVCYCPDCCGLWNLVTNLAAISPAALARREPRVGADRCAAGRASVPARRHVFRSLSTLSTSVLPAQARWRRPDLRTRSRDPEPPTLTVTPPHYLP
jgi:hypothetical protein